MRLTHGRCRPCGLLYSWAARPGRRLRDAHCARCGQALRMTAPSLLIHAENAEAAPLFTWTKAAEARTAHALRGRS